MMIGCRVNMRKTNISNNLIIDKRNAQDRIGLNRISQ